MSAHARWATDEELAEWWAEHTPSLTPLDARVTIVISDLRASLALIAELQDAVEHQRGMYEREHNTVHELQQRIASGLAGVSALEVDARRKVQTDTPYPTVHSYLEGVHDAYLVALKTLRPALTGTEDADHG